MTAAIWAILGAVAVALVAWLTGRGAALSKAKMLARLDRDHAVLVERDRLLERVQQAARAVGAEAEAEAEAARWEATLAAKQREALSQKLSERARKWGGR